MEAYNLISICGSAFIAVFLVLSFLALFMRFIIIIFPEKEAEEDIAVYAAISSTHSALYPGTKITKIEERK